MKLKVGNPELVPMIIFLKKKSDETKARIWKDVGGRLNKSRRLRATVNISEINRSTSAGDVVIVPGKVLGAGMLVHPVSVASPAFSKQAKDKIMKAGGKCLTIQELTVENPKGSGIKIIG